MPKDLINITFLSTDIYAFVDSVILFLYGTFKIIVTFGLVTLIQQNNIILFQG